MDAGVGLRAGTSLEGRDGFKGMKVFPWGSSRCRGGYSPECLAGTLVESSREAGGFSFGALFDGRHHQLTVVLVGETEASWEQCSAWESRVGLCDQVVATCAVGVGVFSARPMMAVTFTAATKRQREDVSELVTYVAQAYPELYGAAAVVGLELVPLRVEEIDQWARVWWPSDDEEESVWPPRCRTVDHQIGSIEFDGLACVSYECNLDDPEVGQELGATLSGLDVADVVRFARWYRPAMDEHTAVSQGGRRGGVLTVMGSSVQHAEGLATALLGELSAQVRLKIHRLWARQEMAVVASAGVGVLGWQHTGSQVRAA